MEKNEGKKEKGIMTVKVNGWESNLKFSASHFIPFHSKCKRLHGHDYAVDIKIKGQPENGMIMDFVVIKKVIREILEEMDHRLIVPTKSKDIKYVNQGENLLIEYEGKTLSIPNEFIYKCEITHSSSEELSRYICHLILSKVKFPSNVNEIELTLYEGPGQSATWSEGI